MASAPHLRRIALLLALLPQFLLLGLGRGVVICVAPGGDVRVEITASERCFDPAALGTASAADGVLSEEEPTCGPCSDLALVLGDPVIRNSGAHDVELPSGLERLSVAPAFSAPMAGAADVPGLAFERGPRARHLVCMRSVLLRC